MTSNERKRTNVTTGRIADQVTITESDAKLSMVGLRGSVSSAEFEHLTHGLIFLKYIASAFEEYRSHLQAEGVEAEDPKAYWDAQVFWIPPEARWLCEQTSNSDDGIGYRIDEAIDSIERDNPQLHGILPRRYTRSELDQNLLSMMVEAIGHPILGIIDSNNRDLLGDIHEYFRKYNVSENVRPLRVRVRPSELDIHEDDPFREDLLDRFDSALALTHLLHRFEGPCVLAIDAPWGSGKTTFIRMWAKYLSNQGFPVVELSAWSDDYTSDPFVALSAHIVEGLKRGPISKPARVIESIVQQMQRVMDAAAVSAIRMVTAGIIDLGTLSIDEGQQSLAQARFDAYYSSRDAIGGLRSELEAAVTSSDERADPLVIVIDELDRCRPTYSIELLEVAKHIFSVDGIVFVLAVNRNQLAQSIRGLYGAGFDADAYLHRFFDVDIRLPSPDRTMFIASLIETVQLKRHFDNTEDDTLDLEVESVLEILHCFLGTPIVSLRDVEQAIRRLGFVLSSLHSHFRSFALTATVLTVLRTIDSRLYGQFVDGEVDDVAIIDDIFSRSDLVHLRSTPEAHWFTAVIILANEERTRMSTNSSDTIESPLVQLYRSLENRSAKPEEDDQNRSNAVAILKVVDTLRSRYEDVGQVGIGFLHSVSRLELFSTSFIGHPSIYTSDLIQYRHHSDSEQMQSRKNFSKAVRTVNYLHQLLISRL